MKLFQNLQASSYSTQTASSKSQSCSSNSSSSTKINPIDKSSNNYHKIINHNSKLLRFTNTQHEKKFQIIKELLVQSPASQTITKMEKSNNLSKKEQ